MRYEAKLRQNRERKRRQYQALPDEDRAALNRAQYAAIKADPERYARRRAKATESQQLRRAAQRGPNA